MKNMIKVISENLKKETTFQEQIELLRTKNIIIDNEEEVIEILKRNNYYFISGYLHKYKLESNKYQKINFNKIYSQILFDTRLREIFMYILDNIEKTLKTLIAYHFSHTYEYGNIAYLYENYFNNAKGHKKLIFYYKKSLENNKDLPFVKHHINKYSGILPIWVAIEIFTLGNVQNFYSILKSETQKKIANEFKFPKNKILNWIECIRIFRNMVAHNQRLYDYPISKTPMLAKEYKNTTYRIFDYLVCSKYLYLNIKDWNNYVIPRLEYIFKDFSNEIDLKCIGFPKNWKDILSK